MTALGAYALVAACGDTFTSSDLPPISDDGSAPADAGGDAMQAKDAPSAEDRSFPTDAPGHPDAPAPPVDGAPPPLDASMPDGAVPPRDAGIPDAFVADTFAPDACATEVANDADAVFVVHGALGTTCAMADPCPTFEQAFARLGGKTKVYVAEGSYTESFDLPPGITVQGGWVAQGAAWTRDCDATAASKTLVTSDGTKAYAVRFVGTGASTLGTMSFTSDGTSSDPSVYGIFVSGAGALQTTLTLDGVRVTAAAAKGGSKGDPGGTGGQGSGTCASSDGATGGPGSAGNGGAPQYTSGGYVAGVGAVGGVAGNGHAGVAPTTGPGCVNGIPDCSAFEDPNDGACAGVTVTPNASCGTAGASGCGGAGGGGGHGGSGGGSSIALYVWNATVTASGGTLSAANGGNGADGGDGGNGGGGSSGQAGQMGPIVATACKTSGSGPTFSCVANGTTAGTAGGAGGTGATGGTGGVGGGGSGGDSFAYFAGSGASVSVSAGLVHGSGGSPGATGAGAVPPTPSRGADHN